MKSILAVATILLLWSSVASAQWHGPDAPNAIAFQGRLTDLVGDPVADGNYSIRFRMYKGSSHIWEQTHATVPVSDGVFNVIFTGTVTWPLDTVAFNEQIDLGIKVGTDTEMTPRTALTSAAYALGMRGMYAVWSDGGPILAPNLIGGASNNFVEEYVAGATISGGGGWTFEGPGLPDSVLGSGGTIGGGFLNSAGYLSTIAGGKNNKARDAGGAIGGGINNTAGNTGTVSGGGDNFATAQFSTVGGGAGNRASEEQSTVGGGLGNLASGNSSTIGGGYLNEARGNFSTIPGGRNNKASQIYSFSAGQAANANHSGTFVWADSANLNDGVEFASTDVNQFLIRAGGGVGIGMNAPANQLSVAGSADVSGSLGIGTDSPARLLHLSGGNAVVRIDRDQGVGGPSILLNQYAPAEPDTPWNSFVMVASATSSGVGAFEIRDLGAAVGGVGALRMRIDDAGFFGLNTGSSAHPLQVGTAGNTSTGNGAHVTTGGDWTNGSSRTFKTEFRRIDQKVILEQLASVPITEWEYKESREGRHLGPVAEDFYEAFGLGNDNRYIGTTDAAGVSMAAIQGLYELVKEQQAIIASQSERIAALEVR